MTLENIIAFLPYSCRTRTLFVQCVYVIPEGNVRSYLAADHAHGQQPQRNFQSDSKTSSHSSQSWTWAGSIHMGRIWSGRVHLCGSVSLGDIKCYAKCIVLTFNELPVLLIFELRCIVLKSGNQYFITSKLYICFLLFSLQIKYL